MTERVILGCRIYFENVASGKIFATCFANTGSANAHEFGQVFWHGAYSGNALEGEKEKKHNTERLIPACRVYFDNFVSGKKYPWLHVHFENLSQEHFSPHFCC